jgi:imidazoleglycerol-phosphate dehydratase
MQKLNKKTEKRQAQIKRDTTETQIELELNLDGSGVYEIDLETKFLKHMLELFSKHSGVDLKITAKGDNEHHLVEDLGIALGQAFREAIGDKKGINRYGFFMLPMDECLTTVAFDFSGRSSFKLECEFKREKVSDLSTELVEDFWLAFTQNSMSSLIIKSEFGRNDHHKIEGIFKATARSIKAACSLDESNIDKIASTKGVL